MKCALYVWLKQIYHYCLNKWVIRKYSKTNSIGRHVYISPGTMIGFGCKVGDRVRIGNEVVLANNVTIGSGLRLERITIWDSSVVEGRVVITGHGGGSVFIGHDAYIGPDTALDFSDRIIIGNYVHIAGLSTGLWTHSSVLMCLNNIPLSDMSEKHRPTAPIVIDDNVYIGGNCTIYPGVRIGHHSVVAPNSAVSKDVPPYSMVGGVPARFIKSTERLIEGSSGQTQQGQEGNSNE